MSTNMKRTLIFILAGSENIFINLVMGFIKSLFQQAGITNILLNFIINGIVGLLIFELMDQNKKYVRLITLPIFGALYMMAGTFISVFIGSVLYNSFDLESLAKFETYGYPFTNLSILIYTGIIMAIGYFFVNDNKILLPSTENHGPESTSSSVMIRFGAKTIRAIIIGIFISFLFTILAFSTLSFEGGDSAGAAFYFLILLAVISLVISNSIAIVLGLKEILTSVINLLQKNSSWEEFFFNTALNTIIVIGIILVMLKLIQRLFL
jgi:hypothetical protein